MKVFKVLAVNLLILVILVSVVEIRSRINFKRTEGSIVTTGAGFIECDHEFSYVPHPLLGYFYNPGNYDCMLNSRSFHMTILPDTSRNTGYVADSSCEAVKQLFMFGCSYTWGHGLSDEETMAFKLQQDLPCWKVSNYGIGGGSTVQSYLLLEALIKRGQVPDIAVLNYGSIHDERNAFIGSWRLMWEYMLLDNRISKGKLDYGKLRIPYALRAGNGEIRIEYYPVYKVVRRVPLSGSSHFMNWIHMSVLQNRIAAGRYDDLSAGEKQDLSFQMIKKLNDLCEASGITLVVAGIYKDATTARILEDLLHKGIHTVDISVDILDPDYNLMPDDSHPNPEANTLYAQVLRDYLVSESMGQ